MALLRESVIRMKQKWHLGSEMVTVRMALTQLEPLLKRLFYSGQSFIYLRNFYEGGNI